MGTISRTYLMTSKDGLGSIQPKNGQVIAVYDSDEVYYDAPDNGTTEGNPVRRKISGVKVIESLNDFIPAAGGTGTEVPMEGIIYAYIGDHGTLPSSETDLYDLRIWVTNSWCIVGSNRDDINVQTNTSSGKFYLTGTSDAADGSIGTLLKSTPYIQDGVINGDLNGEASYAADADHANDADDAVRAERDISNKFLQAYLYDVSSNATTNLGSTLTFTLGNGTTKSVRVSDTTYSIYTDTKAGLVAGTNTTVLSDNTGLVLSGSGWIATSAVTIGTATKAINDNRNQQIDSTYIKGGSFNTTTKELTLTKGDGTSLSAISIPYVNTVFSTTADGLVPKANGTGDTSKYLRGDHTWQAIPTYVGATSGAAGVAGLVPAASSGTTTKYLRSDGTWNGVFAVGSDGLVPASTSGDSTKFLRGDGIWASAQSAENTAGSNQDTAKLFIVGTKAQTTGTTGAQSYSNSLVYIQNSKLYSNNAEVVNVSDAQNLTNKTFGPDNYVLDEACTCSVATTLNEEISDEFNGDGATTSFDLSANPSSVDSVLINGTTQSSSDYTVTVSTDPNVPSTITFNTAPANGAIIQVNYYDDAYDSDALAPAGTVVSYIPGAVLDTLNNVSYTDIGVIADIYDDSNSYAVGDFCTYKPEGSTYALYRCITATSGENFDPTKWDEVSVADILVRVPTPPTTDGTYTLQVTVSSGVPSFGWI